MLSMWDILLCLHKNKRIIVLITLISAFFGYYYTDSHQSYTAQVVIKYIGPNAKDGVTEDGSILDPYEITNPQVIERALDTLSLPKGRVASVRTRINVSPIVPKREEEKDKSIIQNAYKFAGQEGEDETDYKPVYYKVTFFASKNEGNAYARNILNAVMDQYVEYYSEKYLHNAEVSKIENDMNLENYDYIEMMDIMDNRLTVVTDYISEMSKKNSEFRSSTTGYTFLDISDKIKYISQIELPIIYGEIMDNSVTDKKDYIIKNYEYQSENNAISSASEHQKSEQAYTLMKLYAEKNQVSLWDENNDNAADQASQVTNVEDAYNYSRAKATYDKLLDDFTESEAKSRKLNLKSISQKSMANQFRKFGNNATDEQKESVKLKISALTEECSVLIRDAVSTIEDYNSFISADSIKFISGILVSQNLYPTLYIVIFTVFGGGLSSVIIVAWHIYRNIRHECIDPNEDDEDDENDKDDEKEEKSEHEDEEDNS